MYIFYSFFFMLERDKYTTTVYMCFYVKIKLLFNIWRIKLVMYLLRTYNIYIR